MVYTEIKNRKNKKYFYRTLSVRKGDKVTKQRQYLGVNISRKELLNKEKNADKKFSIKTKDKKILKKIKDQIIKILKNNKIKKAGIFGSYAKGKNKKSSDIDIIIEPEKNTGFGFFKIQAQLEEKLGKKIDLITYNSIHPLLKERILNEEVRII